MYFRDPMRPLAPTDGASMRAGLLLTAIAVVLLGIFPGTFVDWAGPSRSRSSSGHARGGRVAAAAAGGGWQRRAVAAGPAVTCEPFVHIVAGDFGRTADTLWWTLEVEEIPDELTFNALTVPPGFLEYRWAVDIDSDRNGAVDLRASVEPLRDARRGRRSTTDGHPVADQPQSPGGDGRPRRWWSAPSTRRSPATPSGSRSTTAAAAGLAAVTDRVAVDLDDFLPVRRRAARSSATRRFRPGGAVPRGQLRDHRLGRDRAVALVDPLAQQRRAAGPPTPRSARTPSRSCPGRSRSASRTAAAAPSGRCSGSLTDRPRLVAVRHAQEHEDLLAHLDHALAPRELLARAGIAERELAQRRSLPASSCCSAAAAFFHG